MYGVDSSKWSIRMQPERCSVCLTPAFFNFFAARPTPVSHTRDARFEQDNQVLFRFGYCFSVTSSRTGKCCKMRDWSRFSMCLFLRGFQGLCMLMFDAL